MEKIFVPHELKTIEIDVEKKIFRVNGEDFGRKTTGFTIRCEAPEEFNIELETETTIRHVTFSGTRETAYKESRNPFPKRVSAGSEEGGNQGNQILHRIHKLLKKVQ